MTKEIYRIGDVANLMGLSRDTLRYYEKRGILSSRKADNGYRYYTNRDISKMLSILYQRKMDIGLNDIETLWAKGNSIDSLSQILDTRLQEEEQEIRRHQQTMARLHMSRNDCENIKHHLNEVQLKNFPRAHVIVPHTDIDSSMALWFQYAQQYPGLDMMYLFDEYTWNPSGSSIEIEYNNSQLILGQDTAEYVDYDFSQNCHAETEPVLCVSTLRASSSRIPTEEDIRPMIQWASQQDLMISHKIFCTFTMQGIQNGKQAYYLQLYLPVF